MALGRKYGYCHIKKERSVFTIESQIEYVAYQSLGSMQDIDDTCT